MTVVRRSRRTFDAAVNEPLNIVLILAGDADSLAQAVHDDASRLTHEWRKVFILRNVDVLDEDEQELWVSGPERFAFYNSDREETVAWGDSDELATADGVPDILEIRKRFAEAEV